MTESDQNGLGLQLADEYGNGHIRFFGPYQDHIPLFGLSQRPDLSFHQGVFGHFASNTQYTLLIPGMPLFSGAPTISTGRLVRKATLAPYVGNIYNAKRDDSTRLFYQGRNPHVPHPGLFDCHGGCGR